VLGLAGESSPRVGRHPPAALLRARAPRPRAPPQAPQPRVPQAAAQPRVPPVAERPPAPPRVRAPAPAAAAASDRRRAAGTPSSAWAHSGSWPSACGVGGKHAAVATQSNGRAEGAGCPYTPHGLLAARSVRHSAAHVSRKFVTSAPRSRGVAPPPPNATHGWVECGASAVVAVSPAKRSERAQEVHRGRGRKRARPRAGTALRCCPGLVPG